MTAQFVTQRSFQRIWMSPKFAVTMMTRRRLVFQAFATLFSLHSCNSIEYGVDCSFPQHSTTLKCGSLLGDRATAYQEFMLGCQHAYGNEAEVKCNQPEASRLYDNRERVQHVINFTTTGYHKAQVPKRLWNHLYSFWLDYKDEPRVKEDFEEGGNVINHWDAPTYMVSLMERQESRMLLNEVYGMAKRKLEAWTKMELRPVSVYGIRVYERGAILAPHVDRYPLVTSMIINVDQDVDEPWPLEVIGRDGRAVNITMKPRDMVFYESHSLVHGRPFALNGTYMANVFCHFEPTGRLIDDDGDYYWKDGKEGDFPPYIVPGSPEEYVWRRQFPNGWEYVDPTSWEEKDEEEDDWDEDYEGDSEDDEEFEEEDDEGEL